MPYNESQKKAVGHREGPMLVLAGPGSGKTAVITGRTVRLTDCGISPSSVLVVTFTRAAAAEMKGRFLKMKHAASTEVVFGTFHSIYYGILRSVMDLGPGSILTDRVRMKLIREILDHTWRGAAGENELPQKVAREIGRVKSSQTDIDRFYSSVMPEKAFRQVYRQYEQWKDENRRIDFDDIIVKCYELFRDRPEELAKWQRRFQYILVDEFQDISPLQYQVIRMLAAPENNLFIVGDDDQSIYRFRGASPKIMLGFPKDYPEAETVTLDVNYRSTPQIISAAGKLICHNRERFPKNIQPCREAGPPVRHETFENTQQECRHLTDAIRKAHAGGTSYREMAVLSRTNSGCRQAVEQMMSAGIPFRIGDVIPCVFDHWIAQDVLAYMELGAGSRKRSDFLRIYNKPNRYFSRDAFYDSNVPFQKLYSYYEDKDWMCRRVQTLEDEVLMIGNLAPYGAITFIRQEIGYESYVRAYAKERGIPEDDLVRVLDELTESARNYRTYADWKKSIEKFRERLASRRQEDADRDSVTISTLHASKGMEYDDVYILDVNEGVIPYQKAKLHEDLEEERRMLYVGMTRARKNLCLFTVRTRFDKAAAPSRFLKEIFS